MLQRPSANVLMYLKRAAVAREHARDADTAAEKDFHHRMESAWMNLAARSAFVEHVDLFVHTTDGAILPDDGCPRCHGLMVLETAEIRDDEDVFGFRCQRCDTHETRSVLPHSATAMQALAPSPRWDAVPAGG